MRHTFADASHTLGGRIQFAFAADESVRLIRAFNVLRQYEKGFCVKHCVFCGGLMIEVHQSFGKFGCKSCEENSGVRQLLSGSHGNLRPSSSVPTSALDSTLQIFKLCCPKIIFTMLCRAI
jgi:hypothetical protein